MTKYLIIAIFLFGCNKAQRQLEKTQLYLFKHPEFTAGVCAENFPDKPDSIIVRTDTLTEIIINDPIFDVTDTAYFDTSNCKPITILKTIKIRKDSIIYRENKAEQHRLELALLSCQDNNNAWLNKYSEQERLLADWKKKAKTRWLWIALLIGGAATVLVFKVIKGIKPKLPA